MGGSISKPRAKEYATVVSRFLCHFDILARPERITEFLTPTHVATLGEVGRDKGPSWKARILNCLIKFTVYLEERALVPSGFANEVRMRLKGYSLTLSKQGTLRRVKAQT